MKSSEPLKPSGKKNPDPVRSKEEKKPPRVGTTINNILKEYTTAHPNIPFGEAYDTVVAYVRRTQSAPHPTLPVSPTSSLEGITPEHAVQARIAAREIRRYNGYDIDEVTAESYAAYRHWRF